MTNFWLRHQAVPNNKKNNTIKNQKNIKNNKLILNYPIKLLPKNNNSKSVFKPLPFRVTKYKTRKNRK